MIQSMNSGRMINRIFRAALTAMLIADLAEVISSITDGMLTGHCLGPACMAAYGIVKPFYSITGIISAILSSGALTLSAHYVGIRILVGMAKSVTYSNNLKTCPDLPVAVSAATAVVAAFVCINDTAFNNFTVSYRIVYPDSQIHSECPVPEWFGAIFKRFFFYKGEPVFNIKVHVLP